MILFLHNFKSHKIEFVINSHDFEQLHRLLILIAALNIFPHSTYIQDEPALVETY